MVFPALPELAAPGLGSLPADALSGREPPASLPLSTLPFPELLFPPELAASLRGGVRVGVVMQASKVPSLFVEQLVSLLLVVQESVLSPPSICPPEFSHARMNDAPDTLFGKLTLEPFFPASAMDVVVASKTKASIKMRFMLFPFGFKRVVSSFVTRQNMAAHVNTGGRRRSSAVHWKNLARQSSFTKA